MVAATRGIFAFDASGSTNGKVTLQVDLIRDGYGIMDNFLITASDSAGGGIDVVPVPASPPPLPAGPGGFGLLRRRRG